MSFDKIIVFLMVFGSLSCDINKGEIINNTNGLTNWEGIKR